MYVYIKVSILTSGGTLCILTRRCTRPYVPLATPTFLTYDYTNILQEVMTNMPAIYLTNARNVRYSLGNIHVAHDCSTHVMYNYAL
jgi:hypothetical protein